MDYEEQVGSPRPQSFNREGCSDIGCLLHRPKGMHTNASKCYCTQSVVRAYIESLRKEVKQLKTQLRTKK